MTKYFVLAAALMVLAVACNKKEETAPATETTVEQTAPAESDAMEANEAAPEATEEAAAE